MSRRTAPKSAPAARTAVPPTVAAVPSSTWADHWAIRIAAPLILLALYAALSLSAVATKCNTFDEIAHLTAGYTYWKTDAYRLQPENGNLPQRWGAIPLLLGDYKLPPQTDPNWKRSEVFRYGRRFFFSEGNNTDQMLLSSRAMMLVMGVACGAVVYFWSRRTFGPIGGLLSLTLFALCPTMLAHGPLITSDMTAALFFLLAVGGIWRLLHRIDWKTIVLCGLAVGGLCIAKFSSPLLLPIAALLLVIRILDGRPLEIDLPRFHRTENRRLFQLLYTVAALVVQCAIVLLVIWAAYSFRFSASSEWDFMRGQEAFFEPWSRQLEANSFTTKAVAFARDHKLLPEAFLYGFAYVLKHSEMRQAFLNGQFSITGWRSFFPYAVLMKTPTAIFGMLALAIVAAVMHGRHLLERPGVRGVLRVIWRGVYITAPLTVLLAIYWAAAIKTNLNIGHRHVLLTYPVLYILLGVVGLGIARRQRFIAAAAGALVICLLVPTLWLWPDYLTFFNAPTGGPWNGYKHLVDSSLDWGQDLPAASKWIKANGQNAPNYLCYFGTGDPVYWNVAATRLLPDQYLDNMPAETFQPYRPGNYLISATFFQSVYILPPGKWTAQAEELYQALRPMYLDHLAWNGDPQLNDKLLAKYGPDAVQMYIRFPMIRFARMVAALRAADRKPDDEIGHSILVFKLTAEELTRALEGTPPVGR